MLHVGIGPPLVEPTPQYVAVGHERFLLESTLVFLL